MSERVSDLTLTSNCSVDTLACLSRNHVSDSKLAFARSDAMVNRSSNHESCLCPTRRLAMMVARRILPIPGAWIRNRSVCPARNGFWFVSEALSLRKSVMAPSPSIWIEIVAALPAPFLVPVWTSTRKTWS